MTGRHAAPPDEAFDQRERDRAGAHRADVAVPLGPDHVPAAATKKPARAKPARAQAAPVKKAAPTKQAAAEASPKPSPKPAPSTKAGKR